jgi:hypothetical protein
MTVVVNTNIEAGCNSNFKLITYGLDIKWGYPPMVHSTHGKLWPFCKSIEYTGGETGSGIVMLFHDSSRSPYKTLQSRRKKRDNI